jgi:hypothetical protein
VEIILSSWATTRDPENLGLRIKSGVTILPFKITFPALWQETEKEKTELRKIQADIDAIYLQNQVLLPEEIALNRFGSGSFSVETSIDIENRKGILESDIA